jgi:hypothetical protein
MYAKTAHVSNINGPKSAKIQTYSCKAMGVLNIARRENRACPFCFSIAKQCNDCSDRCAGHCDHVSIII